MDIKGSGTRRTMLKAGVAIAALTAAAGVLAACDNKAEAPATPTAPPASAAPVATTTAGKVKGFVEDGVNGFKGVRYGADTGKNRFGPPAAPEPWTDVKDAVAYGDSTPQNPGGDGGGLFKSWRPQPGPGQSEDCLFLNVWTPALDDKKRPVMVWFHGGGFTTGSGSSLAYDGVRLAKRGDVVVVTVNHRLNVFGHLNLEKYGPEFADSANVGSLDMIHALKWVRDNIPAFGGDPGKVMIFGQSGGGAKICTLLAMDGAKGLFHRGIIESGPRIKHATMEASGKAADAFVAKLGLTKANLAEIKTKPVADLLAAFKEVPAAGSGPVLDGRSITRDPFDADSPSVSNDIPVMIGCCRTEGTSLVAANTKPFDITWDTLPAELKKSFPKKDPAKIIAAYKKVQPNIEAPEVWFEANSDARFFQGSVTIADRRSAAAGAAPIYFYEVDWVTPVMDGKRYVPHALEIGMVFDNVAKSESMSGTEPEAQQLADIMSETWIAFTKTGDPNNAKIPMWPAYNAKDRPMMVFKQKPEVQNDIRKDERALLTA
ncbi:MAG: carboxylesterase family protein [Alphaproteobacteria bacterium]